MSLVLIFGITTPIPWNWTITRTGLPQYKALPLCIGWNWALLTPTPPSLVAYPDAAGRPSSFPSSTGRPSSFPTSDHLFFPSSGSSFPTVEHPPQIHCDLWQGSSSAMTSSSLLLHHRCYPVELPFPVAVVPPQIRKGLQRGVSSLALPGPMTMGAPSLLRRRWEEERREAWVASAVDKPCAFANSII